MADDLQIKIGAQVSDAVTGMEKVGSGVDEIAASMRALQGPLADIAGRFNAMAAKELEVADAAKKAAVAQMEFNATLRGQIAGATAQMGAMAAQTRETGSALMEIGPIIAGLAVAEMAKSFAEAGMEVQALHFQMIAAVGSSEAATQAMEFSRRVADQYGISLNVVAQGFADFAMSAVRSGLTIQQTEQAFEGLTVGMRALHLTQAQTERSMYALQEVMTMGSLQLRQQRMLYNDMHVPLATMAQAMGVTTGEFEKMVSKGEVLASDFLPRLGEQLKKNFGEVAAAASDSLQSNLGRSATAMRDMQAAYNDHGGMDAANQATKAYTAVLHGLTDMMPEIAKAVKLLEVAFYALGYAENSVVAVAQKAASGFKIVATEMVDYATALKTGVTRGYNAMANEMEAATQRATHAAQLANDKFATDAAQIQGTFDKMNETLWNPKKEKEVKSDTTGSKAIPETKDKSRVSEWQSQLDEMLLKQQIFGDQATALELKYWQAKLAVARSGTSEYYSIVGKVYSLENSARQESISKTLAGYDDQIEGAKKNWAQEREIWDQKVAYLKKMYGDQSTEATKASTAATKAWLVSVNEQEAQQKKLAKGYQDTFMGIAKSFNTAVKGMITGTMSFKQAMFNMLGGLLEKTVEVLEEMVAKALAGYLVQMAANTAKNAALTAGDAAGAAASGGVQTIFQTKQIMGAAATTYAGVFANLSPTLGPFAAVPAGAAAVAVGAQTALLPSFAVGAWQLPGDTMANVHKGEMIVPAGPAAQFRDFLKGMGNGGGGGDDSAGGTTIHIHATDAKSVARLLKKNGGIMAGVLATQARNGNRNIRSGS